MTYSGGILFPASQSSIVLIGILYFLQNAALLIPLDSLMSFICSLFILFPLHTSYDQNDYCNIQYYTYTAEYDSSHFLLLLSLSSSLDPNYASPKQLLRLLIDLPSVLSLQLCNRSYLHETYT